MMNETSSPAGEQTHPAPTPLEVRGILRDVLSGPTGPNSWRRAQIAPALDSLTDRERNTLIWLYGLDGAGRRRRDSVAALLGTTPARMTQIENRALHKMTKPYRFSVLCSALPR